MLPMDSKKIDRPSFAVAKLLLFTWLSFLMNLQVALASENSYQEESQKFGPQVFHVIFDILDMTGMKGSIEDYRNESKCPAGFEMQEQSTSVLLTSPAKAFKNSECPYIGAKKSEGYHEFFSQIFKAQTCAEANGLANSWAEDIIRANNAEGKKLKRLGDNICSYYTSQTFETMTTKDGCESKVAFRVQLGPFRDSFRFRIEADVKRRWVCVSTTQ